MSYGVLLGIWDHIKPRGLHVMCHIKFKLFFPFFFVFLCFFSINCDIIIKLD